MYKGYKILCVIPARGGSKGVPLKNIYLVNNKKPLITWTIDAALKSSLIDKCILSSDSQAIIDIALRFGCEVPFVRPKELSTDESKSSDVLLHAITCLSGYDYAILLQPTSPLRNYLDVDGAIKLLLDEPSSSSCASVTESIESPYWAYNLSNNRLNKVINGDSYYQRQQLPQTFKLNGAIYIIRINEFLHSHKFIDDKTLGYIMPRERSLDIDTYEDLKIFENILLKKNE